MKNTSGFTCDLVVEDFEEKGTRAFHKLLSSWKGAAGGKSIAIGLTTEFHFLSKT